MLSLNLIVVETKSFNLSIFKTIELSQLKLISPKRLDNYLRTKIFTWIWIEFKYKLNLYTHIEMNHNLIK